MVGFFLNICPNVIDIPLAMAGIYNFSQNVIGLRSTCFAFEVNACISRKNNFYHINPQNRVSYIVYRVSSIAYRLSLIAYRLSLIVYRLSINDKRYSIHESKPTVLMVQQHKSRYQHIQYRQRNQGLPTQIHQLVIPEPGDRPPDPHKKENKNADLKE